MNARVRYQVINQQFNEENKNGEKLIALCRHNTFKINNKLFEHKTLHKITLKNSRVQSSSVCYNSSNIGMDPTQISNVLQPQPETTACFNANNT